MHRIILILGVAPLLPPYWEFAQVMSSGEMGPTLRSPSPSPREHLQTAGAGEGTGEITLEVSVSPS